MVGVAAASKFGDAVATGATSIVGEGGAVGVGAETGVLTGEAIAVADEESEGAVVRLVDGRRVAEAVPAVGATLSQAKFPSIASRLAETTTSEDTQVRIRVGLEHRKATFPLF